jgi:hypothetical protein
MRKLPRGPSDALLAMRLAAGEFDHEPLLCSECHTRRHFDPFDPFR